MKKPAPTTSVWTNSRLSISNASPADRTPAQAFPGRRQRGTRSTGDCPDVGVQHRTMRPARELAYGRDFVALAVDLHLPEDHAGVVFHRRDHPAPVLGTSQVLPVHGDRRMCRAVLAGPLTDGVVQGLRDCGRGIPDDCLSVGELTTRGYYLGSNVTYNLEQKLVASANGLAGKAAGQPQRAPVRRAVAPGDIHRLRI